MVGGEKQKKFDVSKYPRPPGILSDTWSHLEMRPRFIKEYPFEIEIAAVPCSGNSIRGNGLNHAFRLALIIPVWTEAFENGLNWGQWDFNSRILLNWTPIEKLPKTFKVDSEVFDVELRTTHDICPQCR